MNKSKGVKAFMDQMPAIKANISDDLDKRFRDAIYNVKGMKRGHIQEAVQEAIEMWISAKERKGG
ncbi:MAG: hypothetical protein OEW87_08600 [Flavobacteriaceae bacterium]|nr:hypothetical protein [Flavobacteriaceae bacterium]